MTLNKNGTGAISTAKNGGYNMKIVIYLGKEVWMGGGGVPGGR